METTCPSCLRQLTVQDGVNECECNCGNRFNPTTANFEELDDFPPLEGPQLDTIAPEAPKKESVMGLAVREEMVPPASLETAEEEDPLPLAEPELPSIKSPATPEEDSQSAVPPVKAEELEGEYRESTSSFAEIRAFGETLVNPDLENKAAEVEKVQPAKGQGGEVLLVPGGHLEGYQIQGYLAPVSVVSEINLTDEDPLRKGVLALWNRIQSMGANGAIGFHWVPSSDFTKVVVSGTPVRCSRI